MRNRLTIIICGLIFLIFWLFNGYPFDISNLLLERIITLLISSIIGCIIFIVFKQTLKTKNLVIKIFIFIILIPITIIYSWIGLWTFLISHENGPVWEDIIVYTNSNNAKVISQFRETSGSIYDYRERKILYEFSKKDRISIEWSEDWMKGTWNAIDTRSDSSYQKNFAN